MRPADWIQAKSTVLALVLPLVLSLAVAGCGGGLYHSVSGPPPPDTVTFPAASTQGWLQQYGTGYQPASSGTAMGLNGDIAYGVATDSLGNVIVLDETFGAFPGFTSNNGPEFAVVKFDNAGNRLWTQQFGSGGGDFPRAIATDSQGNIFVGGATDGAFTGFSNTTSIQQSVVIKLNPSGQMVWTQQLALTGPSGVTSLATDSQGNVIAGGEILSNMSEAYSYLASNTQPDDAEGGFVMKLAASNGATLWNQMNNVSATVGSNYGGVDSAGLNYEINGVAVDGQGNVIAVGGFPGLSSTPSTAEMVAKLNGSTGQSMWEQLPVTLSTYGAQTLIYTGVALDAQGNIFLGGVDQSTGYSRCVVVSLANSSGTQQWQQEFGAVQACSPGTVATDAAGNVLMTGNMGSPFFSSSTTTPPTPSSPNDVFVAKLTGSGAAVWLQQFGTGKEVTPNSSSVAPQVFVATDSQNHAYVAGTTTGAFSGFTNANNANELFVTQFGP